MIEHLPYFLNHAPPSNAEGGTFNGLTVALSYLLASVGCYIALTLANYMAEAQSKSAARGLHWAAAFVLGSSIWSMHFIGMLAFHLKMNVDYDTPRTIFSMIFAIAAAYGVMSFIRMRQLAAPRIIAASLLLGASICSMHYIGMSAMTMDAWLQYRPDLYVVSVIIAIVASLAAMLIFRSHGQYQGHFRQTWRALAAFIMGAAICGMHYTGMAAAVFVPFPICRRVEDQDFNLISLEVAVVTSVIFAIGFTAALQIRERGLWEDGQRKQKFPLGLLMLAFFLTLVSTLWGGANSVYVKWVLGINARQSVEYEDIGNRLDYLRSDMLHLILSILSDPKGEGRIHYNKDIDDYESAIQKAITLAPSPVLRQSAEDVRSDMRLVEADEVKSFALAEDGKLSDAQAALSSDLYKTHVENYSAVRLTFTKTSNDALGASLGAFVNNGAYNLYLSLFVLTLLPSTWLFALRAVRSWRQQMETTRSNLAAREKELQRYIAEIEMSQTAAMKAQMIAEKANAAKSDFLANMSHEIRTPMNGLLGMARLLLGTELDNEQRSWVDIIHHSGENLLNIINDILDFSKIEAGRLKLESTIVDLNSAIAEVTDVLILRAQEKGIRLLVRMDPSTPRFIVGDAVRLKQIILNLMSNAVKFTLEGYVLLDIRADSSSSMNAHIMFRVIDSGIGISQEKLRYVFDKFTQAEESTTRRFGGTGLGLAITQRLIAMMGGTIKVESAEGKGTIFSFDVTLPKARTEPVTRVPQVALDGVRVLVVWDNEMKRDIVTGYLDGWCMPNVSCSEPMEVPCLLRTEHARGEPIRFVILDYQASVQKMMALVEKIRIFPELQDVMFIVTAVFGSPTATRVLNSLEVSALLTKPLLPDQLHSAMRILWDARQREVKTGLITRGTITRYYANESDKIADKPNFNGARVLVVEDMKVNQMLMCKVLEKIGCQSDVAIHGVEAIQKIQEEEYDIVFMDCQMPIMDGFEATRQIRRVEAATDRHTIIVALTADAMTGDREKCLEAGMDDYLNKPFKPEQITSMLKKWVVRTEG